ncbi:MAG: CheR family methyltransferase [Acidiferrobacterales bacterium]
MKGLECAQFLQWALPCLRMRWLGFRKVRGQVCKRLKSRFGELALSSFDDYRAYLERHPDEWKVLDSFCRITISRFYRDRAVYDYLFNTLLPERLDTAQVHGAPRLLAWSIGCASGEEPYTLSLGLHLHKNLPDEQRFTILATDVDAGLLTRARAACYSASSIKDLPPLWLAQAFEKTARGDYWLRPKFREHVQFFEQDIRTVMPDGHFDLILCRNLVFTYFDPKLQEEAAQALLRRLRGGGALIVGKRESWPLSPMDLVSVVPGLGIYRLSIKSP